MAERENLNFYDEIRTLQAADPFQPFVIVMTSGARYDVIDPYSLAAGTTMFAVFKPRAGLNLFPLHQISSIETLEPKKRRIRR